MAVHFVLGPSGSGKSEWLYNKTIETAAADYMTTCYFIVPEQFSLAAQYDLVSRHPNGGIINIDVTSLGRLANAAFSKVPGQAPTFLTEIGKSMVIKRVLSECKDELLMYKRNAGHIGFVSGVKALFSEFLQYSVDEEALSDTLKLLADSPVLQNKLSDMQIVYKAFKSRLGDKVLTAEGVYDALAEVAEKSGLFNNSVIFMDGFTGFTPSQYEILKKLFVLAKDVYISISIEKDFLHKPLKQYDLFYMSNETVQKLEELAACVHTEVAEPVFTDFDKYSSKTLSHLCSNLYKNRFTKADKDDSLTLFAGKDPQEEAEFVAIQIEKLLREGGYRYRDIAVVCSDIDLYGRKLSKELEKLNVRYFLDRKKKLTENESSGFILLALHIMEKGPDTALLIEYSKSGFSCIDEDEACILENYCNALGIRGNAFKKPFTKEYYGRKYISLDEVNNIRARLMDELSDIVGLKKRPTVEISTKFRAFLSKVGFFEKLQHKAIECRSVFDELSAKEYEKVAVTTESILDQLDSFFDTEEMRPSEYREVVEAGLFEAKVGLVPTGHEQILIGDIERTRLKDIKALFILGANEGRFPKPSASGGLISDKDKNILKKQEMTLSPSKLEKVGVDRFYSYITLTRPTERLCISYCMGDDDGKCLPSGVVGDVAKLYNRCDAITFKDLDPMTCLLGNDLGNSARLGAQRHINEEKLQNEARTQERISPEMTKLLYGQRYIGSISRLELFAACPFEHFLRYGMKIDEEPTNEVSALDFGNVAHYALQQYVQQLFERKLDWTGISEDERHALVEQCALEATEKACDGKFKESDKNLYISGRVRDALIITIDMFSKQMEDSDYYTEFVEKPFSIDRSDYLLTGQIDRIDVCDNDKLKAVKVVDYKTSNSPKKFDACDLYYGLSMQLPVYLDVALGIVSREHRTEFKPAAVLYDMIKDPTIEEKEVSALAAKKIGLPDPFGSAVEDLIAKEFRPNGRVTADEDIVESLHNGILDVGSSSKVPVDVKKLDKDGRFTGFTKNSQVLSDDDMRVLSKFALDKIDVSVKKILNGDVSRRPANNGRVSCECCSYSGICGFDVKNGDKEMKLTEYKEADILFKLRGGVTTDGEDESDT